MKNTLLIVTLPLVLSACATTSSQPLEPTAITPATVAEGTPTTSTTSAQPRRRTVSQRSGEASTGTEDPLPAIALSEDLMYRLLSAEFAHQRGDWQSAYMTMLGLAQQTGDPRLARRAAEIAHGARRSSEVMSAVRLWRQLAPASDEATQTFLGFILLGEDLSEARPILEQRLKNARPQTRGLLAFQFQRMFASAKDKVAAFTLLEQVLTPYVDIPEVRLALSQAAFTAGDLPRARQEAQAALAAKPDSDLAVLALVQATPDKVEVMRLLSSFLARHPNAREVRLTHARMLVEEKKYDDARAEFDLLLRTNPQDLTALYALGVLAMQTDDLAAAERHLTTYLEILANNSELERDPAQALLLLAQIAEERNDTEGVLKWLGQIESGEAYLGAQIKRAQIIAKDGDIPRARSILREASTNGDRDEAMVVMAEAQLLRDANRVPEALEVLETGIERLPDNTDLLYDYAMLAEKSGQLDAMESSLRKIIKIAPNHQHAYNALGYSLADRNVRLDEAHELIRKALELAPEDPFILDSMGWVQFRLGRMKEAEDLLRRAYTLRPDVEIAAHLGEVLWVTGQREAAQKLWRDALAKDPKNDTLKSTLARLNANP